MTAAPPAFTHAVEALRSVQPRPEIELAEVPAPQRLAPYAFAMSGAVVRLDDEVATGRLILLHDPAGQDAWGGTFRLVCFVQARLEPEQLGDEMLPVVGWSWLTEALELSGAEHVALGGTVTQTSSVRFGDIAGPRRDDDVELRASWTPVGADLSRHAEAFCALVASAAGLPPVGVLPLAARRI